MKDNSNIMSTKPKNKYELVQKIKELEKISENLPETNTLYENIEHLTNLTTLYRVLFELDYGEIIHNKQKDDSS